MLVSQKKAMLVRALSAHWSGFVQNIQITVFRIIIFGTTEPAVAVQKPMTMGTRVAATCGIGLITHINIPKNVMARQNSKSTK